MGARTNFVIKTTSNPLQDIVLYSHWGGEDSEFAFAHAINKAKDRIEMGDTSYVARIIVSQLINNDWDSETGFGLYVGPVTHEEEYQYKEIDLVNKTVNVGGHVTSIDAFINYQLGVTV